MTLQDLIQDFDSILETAKPSTVMGFRLDDLTREELIVVASIGWQRYAALNRKTAYSKYANKGCYPSISQ